MRFISRIFNRAVKAFIVVFVMASLEEGTTRLASKHEGSPFRMLFAAACVCMGPLTFGYTIGYSSPAIPGMEKDGLLDGKGMTAWFGSLLTVGAIVGGPVGGYSIEKFGRKLTILFASAFFFAGFLRTYAATNMNHLLTGRVFCGFASGMITVSAPVYLAEISTKSLRGLLGAGNQLAITIGILVAYTFGLTTKWQNLALIGAAPAALTILLSYFIPETPRWYVMKNRRSDAILSLSALRGRHTDVEDECRDIEEGLDLNETFSYSEFKKPELYKPLIISLAIMFFQQFSGINAVMFYTVSIFKAAGFQNSELATVVIGAVQVVATFAACILMDRAGRRKLLIIAGSVMTFTCGTFGCYYLAVGQGTPASSINWLAISSLVLYIIGFSLGWGPIPMLVMAEIFPARARGAASGIAMFTNWFCAFIVTKEFITMQEVFGQTGTFWIFGAFCLTGVMFVSKYLPETKGKSLEDIELYFLGRSMTY